MRAISKSPRCRASKKSSLPSRKFAICKKSNQGSGFIKAEKFNTEKNIMNKRFALCFLIFASILFFVAVFDAAAQKKPEPKKDPVLELWKKQRDKAFEKRTAPIGLEAPGIVVPKVLSDSTIKQKAKIDEMKKSGITIPLDYSEIAGQFQRGELVEVPIVTDTYFLDVGGSVSDVPLTGFDFENGQVELKTTDAKYQTLKKLADDFGGTKYDLEKPADRKQFKVRLLRMITPQAKTVLDQLAAAYQKRFSRPLRVTSLTRSVEYQIELNKTNPDSFLVKDKDAIPSHSTGLAFDLGYKHMTAEEQNFLMNKIEDLELKGKADGVREAGVNATLHVFVYADGKAPQI
jgi:hypothetical protein